ncbi:Holliday junction resolvase RuvX [Gephyromycinifex aptenodytis]|uniref:Holliday junction resolvase RuvX n=1 Tax=Gephyromycinifex aptenodytis TaxID=2716227 RepID=UPI0014471DAC|nr:Holliday junction resolvase RuvX [Gephyromycinifex aptenodytis]
MRPGVRIGIDVGSVRVGVARSDPAGILATPVVTLARDDEADADIRQLAELVQELGAIEVIVGLPRTLAGQDGPAAVAAREYARRVSVQVKPVAVRLVDERLTTVDAHRALHASGRAGRRHREVVDQTAAVLILQAALDEEELRGCPPGEPIQLRKPRHKGRQR